MAIRSEALAALSPTTKVRLVFTLVSGSHTTANVVLPAEDAAERLQGALRDGMAYEDADGKWRFVRSVDIAHAEIEQVEG